MITAEQIRAARALLRIEQRDLAARAHVSVSTLRRLEAEGGEMAVTAAAIANVRCVLEEAGAEFVPDGVRKSARAAKADPEEKLRRIMAIARECASLPTVDPDFGEDSLYGDDGLPA